MICIKKFYERNFKNEDAKAAYMMACKFVASNVVNKKSKVEVSRVTWDIQRVEGNKGDLPTFRLTLYYKFDDEELLKQTCDSCKEFHHAFFINENYNCNRCNKLGYEKRLEQKLMIGTEHFKKLLDGELNNF